MEYLPFDAPANIQPTVKNSLPAASATPQAPSSTQDEPTSEAPATTVEATTEAPITQGPPTTEPPTGTLAPPTTEAPAATAPAGWPSGVPWPGGGRPS